MPRAPLFAAVAVIALGWAVISAWAEQTSCRPAAENGKAEEGHKPVQAAAATENMIPVKNPQYNPKKPLRFDSGHAKDNTSCLVCHVDLAEEAIAAKHEKKGITCAACHGDSLTHSGDENNITRPDVIWGRAEIGPFCSQCHAQHQMPEAVEKFRAQWMGKRYENGRLVLKDSTCTDCHGRHAKLIQEGDFK